MDDGATKIGLKDEEESIDDEVSDRANRFGEVVVAYHPVGDGGINEATDCEECGFQEVMGGKIDTVVHEEEEERGKGGSIQQKKEI